MQQLGASFIDSFLIPHLKKNILGNIENDTRLQHIFSYDEELRPEELAGLVTETKYWGDTGTFFDDDIEMREVFLKEFVEFIKRQKAICEGNLYLLAERCLPDKNGKYSQVADENLAKFAFYSVKAIEEAKIKELIKLKAARGEVDEEQEMARLKDGKLVLVRHKGKGAEFDYLTDEEVKRALGNVEQKAKLLAKTFTVFEGEGERLIAFNPDEKGEGKEVSSSLTGLQKQLWQNQQAKIEIMFESAGMFVEAKMKINENGVMSGYAVDKKTKKKIFIEVNLAKPGEKKYRITFEGKKFWLTEEDIKKNQNKSMEEIYLMKQDEEPRKSDTHLHKAPLLERPKRPVETSKKGEGAEAEETTLLPAGSHLTGLAASPVATKVKETTDRKKKEEKEQPEETEETVSGQGVQAAKQEFDAKGKAELGGGTRAKRPGLTQTQLARTGAGGRGKGPRKQKKKGSKVLKVAAGYLAGTGATIVGSGVIAAFFS